MQESLKPVVGVFLAASPVLQLIFYWCSLLLKNYDGFDRARAYAMVQKGEASTRHWIILIPFVLVLIITIWPSAKNLAIAYYCAQVLAWLIKRRHLQYLRQLLSPRSKFPPV